MSKKNQYFATLPSNEIIAALKDRVLAFHRWTERRGEAKKWKKSYDLYFGRHVKGADGNTEVEARGDDGELTAFGVNHYRNLVKSFLSLTAGQKAAYDFRAVNTDQRSLQQARLANNIIDYYNTELRMFRYQKQAAELALVLKTGFIHEVWDTSLGKPLKAVPVIDEMGQPILGPDGEVLKKIQYEGDIAMNAKAPWHVIYNTRLREWSKNKWVIVREYESKYDLSARYPQFKEEIEQLGPDYDADDFAFWKNFEDYTTTDECADELIPVFYFYHLPTPALPQGRHVKYLSNGILLYDGPYQYATEASTNRLPALRIAGGEKFDSAEGYSDFYEIMALQTVVNTLASTIFSNQAAQGVQIIWLPEGCNISEEQLGNLSVLKGGIPGSEPKAVNLTATPAEIFKNIEYVEGAMTKLAGLNAAATGDIDSGNMSGVALGRLQAMALQYSSGFQQAWAEIQEDCGTFTLHLLKKFAHTERMIALGGKHNKGAMQSWTGKDIELIERVVCDLGNPMSRVFAGRVDTADKLLDQGLIKDPTQYLQLIQTGNLDPMLEGPTAKLELIRQENEMLMDGKKAVAMVGDDHIQHGSEHYTCLSDPMLRARAEAGDPLANEIVKNILDHIKEHERLEMGGVDPMTGQMVPPQSPFFFIISGRQPPPPPMPQPGPMGPPPAGPGPDEPPPPGPGPGMPEPPPIPDLPPEVAA